MSRTRRCLGVAIAVLLLCPAIVARQAPSPTLATKPHGLVLVETWDRRSWTARLMGRHWHEYSPPSVLHWFSRAGVRALAGGLGLVEVARGRPPKRLAASHAISRSSQVQ